MLRGVPQPGQGTLKERALYETESRERRAEVFKIAALVAAQLGQAQEARKAYFEFLDAMFPENVSSREEFVARTKDIMEKESGKVYPVAAPSRAVGWTALRPVRETPVSPGLKLEE